MRRKEQTSVKCEVRDMKNELLAVGTLTNIVDRSVEIDSEEGMPFILIGTFVKLIVHGLGSDTRVWAGKVYYSSYEKMRVDDVVAYSNFEKRQFYRVVVEAPVILLLYRKDENGVEKKIGEVPGKMKDLSPGGLLISIPKDIPVNEGDLRVRITLYDRSIEELQIVLCNCRGENGDDLLYGVHFTSLNQREERSLLAHLFRVQQEQIRKSRKRAESFYGW